VKLNEKLVEDNSQGSEGGATQRTTVSIVRRTDREKQSV